MRWIACRSTFPGAVQAPVASAARECQKQAPRSGIPCRIRSIPIGCWQPTVACRGYPGNFFRPFPVFLAFHRPATIARSLSRAYRWVISKAEKPGRTPGSTGRQSRDRAGAARQGCKPRQGAVKGSPAEPSRRFETDVMADAAMKDRMFFDGVPMSPRVDRGCLERADANAARRSGIRTTGTVRVRGFGLMAPLGCFQNEATGPDREALRAISVLSLFLDMLRHAPPMFRLHHATSSRSSP